MKQLLAATILLFVLGLAGFLYRYEVENPMKNVPNVAGTQTASSTACTAETKICPDGSAVGRTGPNCTFAACAAPNVEFAIGSSTIGFVLPSGYKQLEMGAQGQTTVRIYDKSPNGSTNTEQGDVLTISDYPIPAGGSASAVMIANTTFDPSGIQATSTSSFKQVTIGKNTFWVVQIGRFEGQVQTSYYLPGANDVLRFDLIERGVTNWTDANLNISSLPEHQALQRMLATLQIS